ncbi:unnamed protein product, partial [Amoebophrya sp. A25]
ESPPAHALNEAQTDEAESSFLQQQQESRPAAAVAAAARVARAARAAARRVLEKEEVPCDKVECDAFDLAGCVLHGRERCCEMSAGQCVTKRP